MRKIVTLRFVDETGVQHSATMPGFDLTTAHKMVDHMLQQNLPFQAFVEGKPHILDPSLWKGCSVTLENDA